MSDRSEYSKKQRRFSDEQVMSLESMFEMETKLEARKKVQLATELGLQPRQVAIWFQNKRARWKSKQIERDYSILRSNYHHLASQFEALKKEKQALLLQLQKLNDLMDKSRKEMNEEEGKGRRNEEEGSENGDGCNYMVKGGGSSDFEERGIRGCLDGVGVLSDNDDYCSNIKVECLGEELSDPLLMPQPSHTCTCSAASPENWGLLGDNPTTAGGYQLWDFWS